ncbi:MAG: plasmid pRiA4b ORF-3 family protein [Ilumatobacteraceae bacterium]
MVTPPTYDGAAARDGPQLTGRAWRSRRSARARLLRTAGARNHRSGDNWERKVTVEKVLDASPIASLPACIDGRRAGPPEDCGGVWRYDELLEILGDPSYPEHAERAEWATAWGGAALDPDAFGPNEFSDKLRSLHFARFDN